MAAKRKSKGHDDREHAPLPPSASKRWLTCAPSQGYIARLVRDKVIRKRESGPAAQRGTRIHEIAEPWLRALLANPKARYKPGAKADKAEVAEARAYVDFCLARWEAAKLLDPKATCGVEHRSTVTDECWGSCDFWIFAAKRFTSIDLKSGREVVEVVGNTQLLIYALGIIMDRKLVAREVELCVWQPNAMDGPPEKSVVLTAAEFTQEVKRIKGGIAEATRYLDPTISDVETYLARLVAGDHCGWCDALGVCPEANRKASEISSKSFSPVPIDKTSPPAPATLEPDQVAEIMRRAPMFVAWLEAVQVRALELMHKGQRVPGFKVVQKITRRAWKQEWTDAKICRDLGIRSEDLTKTVRLSPAQVEEKLDKQQKERLKRIVFKPEGEPTVVAESDRRVPLLATKINFQPVTREESEDG